MLHIYIDGSSRGNGGKHPKGGLGIVIFDDNNSIIDAYCQYFDNVTNNQMELQACLKAFELLNSKYKNQFATIYSDSSYCINTLTSWIYSWSQNNWTNKKGQKIKNLDIVNQLYKYYNIDFFICQTDFVKIKSHTGNIGNELSDALATADKTKFSNIILKNHINIELSK